MNILQAMQDRALFGPTFRGRLLRGDSWKVWRAFLAALFGLPMDVESSEFYRRHTGRTDAPSTQFREGFVIAGRRSGKSFVAALIAVFLACFRDYGDVLAPGEVGTVMVIASDRRQAGVIFNYVVAFLENPILARMVVGRTKEAIELSNRIRIEVHTCSFRAVRGYTVIAAILDELAFWRDESSANPDSEVLTALRPATATIANAMLLGVSSPYSRRGELWANFRKHYGQSGSDVLVWKAASLEMNPSLSPAVVEAAYRNDSPAAAAEFGAEFRNDIEGFLSAEVVESRVVRGRLELPPVRGIDYAGFVDPSGGANDSMTLGIAHMENERAVLDLIRETRAPFSPQQVVGEFVQTLKAYRIGELRGDRYGAEWVVEQFEKRGISYRPSEKTRSELYLELLPNLMSGSAELLDNPRLIAQLCGLERRTARSGHDSIDHGPGGHDDVANSAAGAIVEAISRFGGGGVLGWIQYLQSVAAGAIDPDAKPLLAAPAVPVSADDGDKAAWWEEEKKRIRETMRV